MQVRCDRAERESKPIEFLLYPLLHDPAVCLQDLLLSSYMSEVQGILGVFYLCRAQLSRSAAAPACSYMKNGSVLSCAEGQV